MAGASLGFLCTRATGEVLWATLAAWLGGALGTVAVLTKQEFMLLMVGGVFVNRSVVSDAASGRLQNDKAHDRHQAAVV